MNNVSAKRAAPAPIERRPFLVRFLAALFSIFAIVAPFAAGGGIVFDPLLRRKKSSTDGVAADDEFIRAVSLDELPADGTPRFFVLMADRSDAWTRIKNQRVGSVYLSRDDSSGTPRVTAFTATCPHLGCAVDFNRAANKFACPCHDATFAADGSRVSGPSQRGLDELTVELRPGANGAKQVFVAYRQFLPGIAERKPIA